MSEKSKKPTKSSSKTSATKSSKSTSKKVTPKKVVKKPTAKAAVKKSAPKVVKATKESTVEVSTPTKVKKPNSSVNLISRAKSLLSKLPKISLTKDDQKIEKQRIHKIFVFSTGLFAFYAVMTLVLAKQSLTSTEAIFFTLTDPASLNQNEKLLGIKDLITYDLRYVFSALFAVSAVAVVLLATKLRSAYEKSIAKNTSLYRWIYAAVSSTIVIKILGLMAGVSDAATLKMSCGLLVIAALLGYISEQVNETSKRPRKLEFWLAVFAGLLAFLPASQHIIGTYYYGVEYLAWYVYAVYAVVAMTYVLFATNHYKQITGKKKFIDAERQYFAIDLVSKTLLYAVVILALYK